MIVFCAACNTYPPKPNTTLPRSITDHIFLNPPKPNMAWPKTQIADVKINTILGPLLSISIPPANGTIMLGKAYKE